MTDEELLCEFVIWRLRERDLPADVARAADRLAPRFPRRTDTTDGYLEADYSVSGTKRFDGDPPGTSDHYRCFGFGDATDRLGALVDAGFEYLLVQRLSR